MVRPLDGVPSITLTDRMKAGVIGRMNKQLYYIVIKLTSPDDTGPVVDLILSSVSCDIRIYQYRGELICFSVGPTDHIDDIMKQIRRLGRGKRRFSIAGHNPQYEV